MKRRWQGLVDPGLAGERDLRLVDEHTQTYWMPGAAAETTLVEAEPAESPRHAHAGGADRSAGLPRGNPALCESLFIELMRGGQFARAFQLLAPECQRSWGSEGRFTELNQGGAMRNLAGVNVKASRKLEAWEDPVTHRRYDHAAELQVQYRFSKSGRETAIERTVHLVGVDGKWRSLCYP